MVCDLFSGGEDGKCSVLINMCRTEITQIELLVSYIGNLDHIETDLLVEVENWRRWN